MDFTQAIQVANAAVYAHFGRYLTDVETAILQGTCQKQTYEQIAHASGYSVSYLTRDVGPKLWKLLSQALGENVSKTNFQAALERYHLQHQQPDIPEPVPVASPVSPATVASIENHCDWGDAVDVNLFYGRTTELNTLKQWVLVDGCHLVAVLGMGGIGKTSLAVKLAREIQGEWNYVIWRSLRNAPPLTTLLGDWVSFLSDKQDIEAKLDRLLYWLRSARCLLILDNVETILSSGSRAGQYRSGYEDYGEFLTAIGQTAHQSCLLITSREKPGEIAALEGEQLAVRSLQLGGCPETAEALIGLVGLSGTTHQKQQLLRRYSYNPLALKIVATSIQDLFAGEIGQFLEQDTVIFNNIRRLLDQQFERLSSLEKMVMFWLAINREWTTIAELAEDIIPVVSRMELLEALESLSWRSLIEKQAGRYTQQPVVMEYVIDQMLSQMTAEMTRMTELNSHLDSIELLRRYPLLKATARDYVRQTQIRLILDPLSRELLNLFGNIDSTQTVLMNILSSLQQKSGSEINYLAGNLVNLLFHLQVDISNSNLSNLSLWQVDFRSRNLNGVNLSESNLSKSVFTKSFGTVYSLAWSQDNRILATGHADGEICLWMVETGQLFLKIKGHESSVWTLAFHPDNTQLASASFDSPTIKLWNIKTGEIEQTLTGHRDWVRGLAFSSDGKILVSCSSDRTIKVWDKIGDKIGENNGNNSCKTLHGHTEAVMTLCLSPEGLLASGSEDLSLRLWDIKSGECLRVLEGHQGVISSVAFSRDGQTLASCEEKTIKLWNVETGDCYQTLRDNLTLVWSVAFSRDGEILAGSDGQILRLWDVKTGKCVAVLAEYTSQIWSIAFSPNGQMLAACDNEMIQIWNVETRERLRTWRGYADSVGSYWCLAFNQTGEFLASGSGDGVVRLWKNQTGECLKILRKHSKLVRTVAFSFKGEILASGGEDQIIWLWDRLSGRGIKSLAGHTDTIWSVSFHPNGELLASGSADQTVKLWEVKTGKCWQTLREHRDRILIVAFSPNGEMLASGSADQTVKLWEIKTGECLQTFSEHRGWVWSLAFSPDGRFLASGSEDRTVKLWDVKTGECLKTLAGHTKLIWSVVFSQDGQKLISGSADKTAKLWDVKTAECLQSFPGNIDLIWAFYYGFDDVNEQIIASGSNGETILLWNLADKTTLKTLKTPRIYEGMNLGGVTGLTEATIGNLKLLGAIT